jgi:formylglycine-generating enzyme required for sulfatase activity
VKIPAGTFIYGEKENQQEINLDEFHIGRYPITNCQYQCFIDAGGYEDERWWLGLIKPEPSQSPWEQPNRPRTNVDWYEAVAFTRWLSAKMDQTIRMPTEQEWEKAARGTYWREYPWDNEYINGYANLDERNNEGDYVVQTTAVGLYPMNVSQYGVRDMTGNIWEWCQFKSNQQEEVTYVTRGDKRVIRGSSWDIKPEHARISDRDWYYKGFRDNRIGFRLVLSNFTN